MQGWLIFQLYFQKRFVSNTSLLIFALPFLENQADQFFEMFISQVFVYRYWITRGLNVNKNHSKNLLWKHHIVFLQSVLIFLLVLLKEIENQPKTLKNFWLETIRLVPLHSHKNGWQTSQKIFESWEATARSDFNQNKW